MDYFKAFETLKTALEKAAIPAPDKHFAVQVRLTDEDCSGIFYIEARDRQLYAEPYDYYDNDADVLTSVKDFKSILEGKLDVEKAVSGGKITVTGNTEEFIALMKAVPKKTVRKTTAKKTAAKAEKPAAKKSKTTAKKITANAKKPTAKAVEKKTEAVMKKDDKKPDKTETISDVVKTETKPAKTKSK